MNKIVFIIHLTLFFILNSISFIEEIRIIEAMCLMILSLFESYLLHLLLKLLLSTFKVHNDERAEEEMSGLTTADKKSGPST